MYAKLPDGRKNLFQWDTGQYMEVSTDVYKIDFVYRENPDMEYGVFAKNKKVKIPNAMLHRSGVMDALVVGKNGEGKATYIRMEIPVLERPMPPGYIITDSGAVSADEIQNALENMHLLSTYGGTMEGNIDMAGRAIRGLVDPVENDEPTRKSWTEYMYLHKDGGDVTGRFTGFKDPVLSSEPATKKYVDDKILDLSKTVDENATTETTATLTASGWSGSGPFTQIVTVSGLTDDRRVMTYPKYGTNEETNLAMREACSCVSFAKRSGSNVIFTCLEDKPEADISLVLEVYV